MKHYTIPFFVIHSGCPGQCIFCDQNRITGADSAGPEDVDVTIKKYLSTIKREGSLIEVGFFGGTFTGMPLELQDRFLRPVEKYIKRGLIKSIRLSTRPDFIDDDILEFLKDRHVKCVELGVQSMSDEVLKTAKRGYSERTVERSADMITGAGLDLGFQMMLGLPGSDMEKELYTAKKAKYLGARDVRIYPLVVMRDTELAGIWQSGAYEPLEEDEAVERAARCILYFEINGINVIRCGLHPSEGLLSRRNYLAGPFHPAFRQKAETWIFSKILWKIRKEAGVVEKLYYNPIDAAAFFGFKKNNRKIIDKIVNAEKERLGEDENIPRGKVKVLFGGTELVFGKEDIADVIPANAGT